MDKKLLDSLNNLSLALEQIADSLKDNKSGKGNQSATTTALQGGKLDKQLQSIDKGVKKLQSDNKKILKNQETLLTLSKKKPAEKNPLDKATDPKQKNKLKDGLASIMMIAVGVLAIGLAFKLIGKVNFLSVIALAIALPLVAIAFERIAKMKDLKASQMKNIILVTVAIATAIALSSWILQLVKPVGIFKLITAVFIAGMFGAISFGIGALLIGLKKAKINPITDWKTLAMLPIVTVAIATAIALSSWILQLVMPVGILKLFTAVFIAAMFGAVSFGIGNLLIGLKKAKINPITDWKTLAMLPIVMVAISVAITLSSYALQLVMPVGILKLFTAVLIAVMFGVISFGLGKLLQGMKNIKTQDIGKFELLPDIMVLMSIAIALSSYALQLVMPVDIFKLLTAVVIAATFVVLSYAVKPLLEGLKGVSLKDIGMASLILIALTATIVAASWILMLMAPIEPSKLFKFLFLGISLAIVTIVMGIAVKVINILGKSEDYFEGGLSIVIIATTVMLSSLILSLGSYDEYPSWEWSLGVGLSMLAFGVAAVALGLIAMSGIGGAAFLIGLPMTLLIAATIVGVSAILKQGSYDLPGILPWATAVALLYKTFTPVLLILGAVGLASSVLSFFGADPFVKAQSMILSVADTIVGVSFRLKGGSYTGGPSEDWAKGVALSIGAFASVYAALAENSGISGPSVKDMNEGIITICDGIVKAGEFFNDPKNKGAFDTNGIPSEDWANGVGGAIGAFMPALKYISDNSGFFKGDGKENLKEGMIATVEGIAMASIFIKGGDYSTTLPEDWMTNVGNNVRKYVDLAKYLSDSGVDSVGGMLGTILGMRSLADGYSQLAKGVKNLGGELDKIDLEKLTALKNLTGSIVLLSLMDSDQFEKMMDSLEDKAKIFVNVMNDLESSEQVGRGTKAASLSSISSSTGTNTPTKSIDDLFGIMQSVDARLAVIVRSNDNLSKYVDEIRGSDLDIKKKK
jgi:hypothetical protein